MWPACQAGDNKAGCVLSWAACPCRQRQGRGRSDRHSEGRHRPGEFPSLPVQVPITSLAPDSPLSTPQPKGRSLRAPLLLCSPGLGAPEPPRPVPGAAARVMDGGARGRRSSWQPRHPHDNAEAQLAGVGPARSISAPGQALGGVSGFPPRASGAAQGAGLQGRTGSSPPLMLGWLLRSGFRGTRPGERLLSGRVWPRPWRQVANVKPRLLCVMHPKNKVRQ